jgi:hypothetical protein
MRSREKSSKGPFPLAVLASVIPSVMRENADGSVFPSVIEPPPNSFSRAIAYVIEYVIARICMFGRHICTITDGETDAAVEMITAKSRVKNGPICVFTHHRRDNGRKKRLWKRPKTGSQFT